MAEQSEDLASVGYESCVLGADGRCTRFSHDHGSVETLDEIAAISQAAGLDELTGEPPIRRPYPLVGPHQGDHR